MFLKTSALIATLFFSISAIPAQAETFHCEGRELLAGNTGRSGTIEVNVEELLAVWQPNGSDAEVLISESEICGASLDNASCIVKDESMSRASKKTVSCRATNPERFYSAGSLVLSQVTANGRARCSSEITSRVIEFNNCQKQ